MTCNEPGCATATREGKPYCIEHIFRMAYAREVMENAPEPSPRANRTKRRAQPRAKRADESRSGIGPDGVWRRLCPVCGKPVSGRRKQCSRICTNRASWRRKLGIPLDAPVRKHGGCRKVPAHRRVCTVCGNPTGPQDSARLHRRCEVQRWRVGRGQDGRAYSDALPACSLCGEPATEGANCARCDERIEVEARKAKAS